MATRTYKRMLYKYVLDKNSVQLNLSLFLIKNCAMKTYWESTGIDPRIPYLGSFTTQNSVQEF